MMTAAEKKVQLQSLIAKNGVTANGFNPHHGLKFHARPQMVCERMVANGVLFRAEPGRYKIRYFLTKQDADVFHAKNKRCIPVPGVEKSVPVKSVKSAVLKTPKVASAQQVQTVTWQPKPKAAPAVIIGLDTCKRSISSWVDVRAVSVPFLRIGDPGFSMSIT
jgi:hypothetical protein